MKPLSHVIPKIEDEIERIKDGLLAAPLADVPALQAEARAMTRILAWLRDDAPEDRSISADYTY